jgi:hypothetical protein
MSPREALEAIDGDAPVREPSASPTVSLDPGHSRDLRDYVDEIIREALVRWHPDDIADEFSPENLTRLLDLIPSASRSMLDSWSVGLFGAERKN